MVLTILREGMELKASWNVFCDGGGDICPNPFPFFANFDALSDAFCDFACACGGFLEGEEVDGAIRCVVGSDGDGIVLLGNERIAVVFEEDVGARIVLRLDEDFTRIEVLIEVGDIWSRGVIKDGERRVACVI